MLVSVRKSCVYDSLRHWNGLDVTVFTVVLAVLLSCASHVSHCFESGLVCFSQCIECTGPAIETAYGGPFTHMLFPLCCYHANTTPDWQLEHVSVALSVSRLLM